MKKLLLLLILLLPISARAQTAIPPIGINVTASANGATDRVEAPALSVSSCTIQAWDTNTGNIYVGGFNVTNNSGANRGQFLIPGGVVANQTMTNRSAVFISTDTVGNKANVTCN